MLTKTSFAAISLLLLLAAGCTRSSSTTAVGKVQGYAPVYLIAADIYQIKNAAAQPITEAGKIYVFGNYLFQNDINRGLHIIDITNRSAPQKLAFISIPYSTEIAVKGNYLYTNNLDDLLTFDITNPASPVLKNRQHKVFPVPNQDYPPDFGAYFECADPAKGTVVKWEWKELDNPKCKR